MDRAKPPLGRVLILKIVVAVVKMEQAIDKVRLVKTKIGLMLIKVIREQQGLPICEN